jgi:hypothetical protein
VSFAAASSCPARQLARLLKGSGYGIRDVIGRDPYSPKNDLRVETPFEEEPRSVVVAARQNRQKMGGGGLLTARSRHFLGNSPQGREVTLLAPKRPPRRA